MRPRGLVVSVTDVGTRNEGRLSTGGGRIEARTTGCLPAQAKPPFLVSRSREGRVVYSPPETFFWGESNSAARCTGSIERLQKL